MTREFREYVHDQARELLSELEDLTSAPTSKATSPREVLKILHNLAKEESEPESTRHLAAAEAALVAGRLELAQQRFEDLAARDNLPPEVRGLGLDRLGDLSWWRGDFKEAADAYRRSLQLRPDDKRTQKDLARALWHLGDRSATANKFGTEVESRTGTPTGQVVMLEHNDEVVEVCGLYVSAKGAGIMTLQGCLDDGVKGLVATGSLGTCAQESCDLAWAIWRRRIERHDIGIRIHASQAGRFKDGPSLGLAVYVLIGAVLGELRCSRTDGFTGELDLKGRVLPIGGASEKSLAAYLSGIRRLFLPQDNLEEVETRFSDILTLQPLVHVEQAEEELATS